MSRQPRILALFGNVPLLGKERANIETLHALMEHTIQAGTTVDICPTIGGEPYGLTVVEAKQRGAASIVFPSRGLTGLITDGADGVICKSKTAAALEEAIEPYADHPSLLAEQGEAEGPSLERLGAGHYGARWMQACLRFDTAQPRRSTDR